MKKRQPVIEFPSTGTGARFNVVRVDPGMVWIVDVGDHSKVLTITNDAESVVRRMQTYWPNHRIIYRDTMGHWDELTHNDGVFTGFRAARHLAPPPEDLV